MRSSFLKIYVKGEMLWNAIKQDQGQDLVEYALVIAVVCLGVISSMSTLANGIDNAMTTLGTKLNSAVA